LDQIGGRLQTNRVLSLRETFAVTLLVRLALASISIAIFTAVFLELSGVGLSPSPSFTRDPVAALGSRQEVDLNVLLLMFSGWRSMDLWIAVGAAFMALPAYTEVDRLRTLLATASPRGRVLVVRR
jgi:hypothetical protein